RAHAALPPTPVVMRRLLPLLALAVTVAAHASEPSDTAPPTSERVPLPLAPAPPETQPAPVPDIGVHAARAAHPPTIDGRLDDPAWAAAPVFAGFILNQPTEGGAGSERTELRVLYDDAYLYIGFDCKDSQPATISRSLARRDNEPASDYVAVFIDAGN